MISSTLLVKEKVFRFRFRTGIDFATLKLSTLYYFINQMRKVNFGQSLNNISAPNQRTYKLQLIENIELFIKKLRSKAIFSIDSSKETSESRASGSVYGLKSKKSPPRLKEAIPFEDDLVDRKKTVTFADKASNIFQLEKEEYHRSLQNAVRITYKKYD